MVARDRTMNLNWRLFPGFITAALFCALLASCGGGSGSGSTTPPLTVTEQTLYTFGGTSSDAVQPYGVLIQGRDGNFYGTTYRGGLVGCCTNSAVYSGNGTVFKITPTGDETVLHLFAGGGVGANPTALIQGSDGDFYGVTYTGGAYNNGIVFKLTPVGVEILLHSFGEGSDGEGATSLIQGSDGNFYGTTAFGGAYGFGTVFKLTPEGVETILYSFRGVPDGMYPSGQLVQGSDGNFYGVTPQGGSGNCPYGNGQPVTQPCGTVFKLTPQGVETVLTFFSGPDGAYPNGGLVQSSDGNFYGTTEGGSNSGTSGTVFEITPEGVETTLYTFTTGGNPEAGLIAGTDGNFYGTTAAGGENSTGTMFQLTPAGVLTVLYSFPSSGPAGPATNLVLGSDGNLYGTTANGGAYNTGCFFKLVVSSQ
jgi:uncharacterized repeat protein (TIGR03803 family)